MRPPRFIIIGAGISGLSLGWFLRQRIPNACITILEKENRPGGWMHSFQHEGFLFEEGPRSCRSYGTGQATLQLIEELGLQKEWLPASVNAKKRFLYVDGILCPLPTGIWSFLTSPLTRRFLPTLCKECFIPALTTEDESIHAFMSRRFNPEFAELLIDPMTSGIYAGDIRMLSMRSCFPSFCDREQQSGSLMKSLWNDMWNQSKESLHESEFVKNAQKSSIFTLKHGMGSLTSQLAEKLEQELQFKTTALSLSISMNSQEIYVVTDQNQKLTADHVFITTPADVTQQLLFPLGIDVPKIPHASLAVVNIGWHGKHSKELLQREGFGYLIPSKERNSILGMVWDSSVFPEQGVTSQTKMTAMFGGSHHPEIIEISEEELYKKTINALENHLGIYTPPDVIHIKKMRHAIPQYLVGHASQTERFKTNLVERSNSRIHVLGNNWNGVSVNDCIAHARQVGMNEIFPI